MKEQNGILQIRRWDGKGDKKKIAETAKVRLLTILPNWHCLVWEGTTKLRNKNETKRNEVSQNETKYIKQSIKDPKTINEGVKINEILSG